MTDQARTLNELGVTHLNGLVSSSLRARLNADINRWIDDFEPAEQAAVFTSSGRHLEQQQFFLASARNVSCFLESGALDHQGQLNCEKAVAINKIGHALHDFSDAFAELARLPALVNHLHQRSDEPWELMQSMVIMKPPRIGGEVNWHQDGTFLIDEQRRCVGIWIALEEANKDNGCLQFSDTPPQGLCSLFETDHSSGETKMRALTDALGTPKNPTFAPCHAGDAVVFDGLTPHASSPNRSSKSRRAITLHFKPAASQWASTNWLQREPLPRFLVNQ